MVKPTGHWPVVTRLFTQTDIDGGLVGAASQELTSFHALINATIATYQRPRPGAGH